MSTSVDQIGFESAFELLDHLKPKFVEYAHARIANELRSKFSAADVVQQTYMESLTELRRKQFQNREQLIGWFHQLLNHNIIDLCRGFRRSQKRDIKKERRLLPKCAVLCSDESILTLLVKAEREEYLSRAIDLLPAHNRNLVIWRFIDGMSYAEISRVTGRTEDCARMSVNRALEKLNQILACHVSLST